MKATFFLQAYWNESLNLFERVLSVITGGGGGGMFGKSGKEGSSIDGASGAMITHGFGGGIFTSGTSTLGG